MRASAIALILFCVLIAVPRSVSAQGQPSQQVAAGYAFLHDSHVDTNFPTSWFASYSYRFTNWLTVVGEGGGSYKNTNYSVDGIGYSTTTSIHTFLAGPRYNRSMGKGTVFGQVLFGESWEGGGVAVIRESVADDGGIFTYQPGGGIEIPLSGNIGARFGVDYRRVMADRETTTEKNSNQFRFAIGVTAGF